MLETESVPRDMGPLPPGSVLVTHLQPENQEGLGCPRVLPTKGTDCHSGPEDEGAVALGQLRVRPSVAPTEESPVALWGLPPPRRASGRHGALLRLVDLILGCVAISLEGLIDRKSVV